MPNEHFLNKEDFIISKTDKQGIITYCNEKFIEISGYEYENLIGQHHKIVRHHEMPKIAFKTAWDKIKNGEDFFGFVKNQRKNGDFYWVFAYISPDYKNGEIIGYTSIRRFPNKNAIKIIEPIYKELILKEKSLNESEKYLNEFLLSKNLSYNEFIVNLQKGKQI